MLSVFRVNGQMMAAMEVRLVDENGALSPNGQYAWCEQLETSEGCPVLEACRYFMSYYATWMPTAYWCYFIRRNKTGQKIHGPYSRTMVERFLNQMKGGMVDATV